MEVSKVLASFGPWSSADQCGAPQASFEKDFDGRILLRRRHHECCLGGAHVVSNSASSFAFSSRSRL